VTEADTERRLPSSPSSASANTSPGGEDQCTARAINVCADDLHLDRHDIRRRFASITLYSPPAIRHPPLATSNVASRRGS
jgi:hypothetical protein